MKLSEKQLNETIKSEIKKVISEMKYKMIYDIVSKCVNEAVESGLTDTHFAILKPINKIIFSWDYSGYDNSELRKFKKDYFMDDIVDNGFNPKDVKILTKNACLKQGINPEDESCWDNAYEYKVESINRRKTLKCVLKEGRGTLRDKLFYAVDKFNSFYNAHKEDVDKHINSLKDSGNYKDFETRLAWDIARATRYNKWDCFEKDEWGYAVLPNDSQVTTLFKQALRNSVIKY